MVWRFINIYRFSHDAPEGYTHTKAEADTLWYRGKDAACARALLELVGCANHSTGSDHTVYEGISSVIINEQIAIARR